MAFLPETLNPGCPQLLLPASLLLPYCSDEEQLPGPTEVQFLSWSETARSFTSDLEFRYQRLKSWCLSEINGYCGLLKAEAAHWLRERKRDSDRWMDREKARRSKDEGEGIFGPTEVIRAVCVCVWVCVCVCVRDRETERQRGEEGVGKAKLVPTPHLRILVLFCMWLRYNFAFCMLKCEMKAWEFFCSLPSVS